MFNNKSQKQKFLSKLIAFTFAFNIIMPVAFASEVNASTTNGVNVSSDILTRKANTQANSFKSQKLNISDEELNNWINNKLQPLIDKGILNITEAEKIKIALKKKFQHIKNLRGNKPNTPVTKPMPNKPNKPVINNPMTKPMPNNQNKPVINNPNAR